MKKLKHKVNNGAWKVLSCLNCDAHMGLFQTYAHRPIDWDKVWNDSHFINCPDLVGRFILSPMDRITKIIIEQEVERQLGG